jgi:hypothetical protein
MSGSLNVGSSVTAGGSITIGTGGNYSSGSIYSDSSWGMIFRTRQSSPTLAEYRWANSADVELMRISPSGSVGIGTSSPTDKLEVQDGNLATYHSVNLNTAGYGINFYTNGGGAKNTIAAIYPSQVGTARSGDLLFLTSNAGAPAERMRITSSGSVGINNSSINPNYYLDVNGLIATTSDSAGAGISRGGIIFKYSTSNVGSRTWIISNDTNIWGDLAIRVSTTQTTSSYNNVMMFTSGGNVLIGTSTDGGYKLEVNGTMFVQSVFSARSGFSGYNTDGLFSANARPCQIVTPSGAGRILLGYNDYGAGQYYGRIGFFGPTNWSLGHIGSAGNDFSIGVDFRGAAFYIYSNSNYSFAGSNVSDSRKKANINYITSNQLDTILKLKPASFNQKDLEGNINSNTHTGFIAQDVLESGIANLVHGSDEGGYGLDYNGVLALAVKAIQELKAEIDILKQQ